MEDETAKLSNLSKFSQEVKFILQTVNKKEYQAAVTYMKPPKFDGYTKSVTYPSIGSVVGMFAGHKAALIQTDVGANATPFIDRAIKFFPNARFVAGVGVGYSFDRNKHKLGDILVSKQISNMANFRANSDGSFANLGQIVQAKMDLVASFCNDTSFDEDFELTKEADPETGEIRTAEAYAGRVISYAALMNNLETRNKFRDAVPEAIGGEMEGGRLLKFQTDGKVRDGVIVIKGVVDYGDGYKEKSWQFTAALAAFAYVENKLTYWRGMEMRVALS